MSAPWRQRRSNRREILLFVVIVAAFLLLSTVTLGGCSSGGQESLQTETGSAHQMELSRVHAPPSPFPSAAPVSPRC